MKIMTAEQEMNAWKKKQQRGPSKRALVRMTDHYEDVNENTIRKIVESLEDELFYDSLSPHGLEYCIWEQ